MVRAVYTLFVSDAIKLCKNFIQFFHNNVMFLAGDFFTLSYAYLVVGSYDVNY